jgi:hypothetical protein
MPVTLSWKRIFNPEGTAVETLLYGPADGDWVDLVALEGAGFLIDCMEISAHILGIRAKRLLLCAGCRDAGRRKICQRSGGLLQADLSIGILPSEERSRTVSSALLRFFSNAQASCPSPWMAVKASSDRPATISSGVYVFSAGFTARRAKKA